MVLPILPEAVTGNTFGLLKRLSWGTFEFSRKVAKMLWLLSANFYGRKHLA